MKEGTLFDQVESENINLARLEDLDDITVGDKEGFVIDNDVDNEEIIIEFEDGEIETYSYTELNKLLNNDKEKDFQDKGLDAGESYWKITVQIAVKGDVLRGKEGKVFSPMRWDDVSENAQVIVNGEWGGLHTVLARYSKSDLDYVGEYKVGGNYMKYDSTGRGSDSNVLYYMVTKKGDENEGKIGKNVGASNPLYYNKLPYVILDFSQYGLPNKKYDRSEVTDEGFDDDAILGEGGDMAERKGWSKNDVDFDDEGKLIHASDKSEEEKRKIQAEFDRDMKNLGNTRMEEGGALDKEFKFDTNFVIYVPSTTNVGSKIHSTEMDVRVKSVGKFVADKFGGFTKTETGGGYKAIDGDVIEEDIVKVSVFAKDFDWDKQEGEVVKKVKEWAKQWGQEAIGFEYEGDLYYIDEEGKFEEGGKIVVYGTKAEVKEMYLDYVNNFLSVEKFAEHYGISEERANRTIEIGRKHAENDGHFARGGEINSTVDALKKGDTISIEFGSSFSDGAKVTLKVRSRNKIKKGTIDKITFENKDKPNTVRYYAYERGKGVWGFAKGDMAISNVKIIDTYAEGGIIKVGKKYGDWAITQYKPITNDDLGGQNDGYLKLVNQDTFNEIIINNDNALRGSKWFTNSVKGIRISDKKLTVVINKSIKSFSSSYAEGGEIKNHSEIVSVINNSGTYMDLYDANDDQTIMYQTRENGSVGEESASQQDIDEAHRLQKIVKSKFNNIVTNVEVVDEWVHLNIRPIKEVKYRYLFHKKGGFTEAFNSFEEMLKKRKTFIKGVDWKKVKKQLDAITKYPNNKFTGWYESDNILISKIGEKGNNWGYDFYVSKQKEEEEYAKGGSTYAEGGSVDVANTILKQIGGRRALVMFTGAKNFIALPNGVSFRIGNRSINYVRITLNGKDLYDVEFALVRGSKMTNKKEFTDVYSDQLKTTFEKATGMYLSFEKGGILSKDEESDFNKWIKDGNANEQSDNVWVEQTTQYKKKFTLDELRTFFKKEYLSYAEGGSIKGRNNKTGETFGVVIGSKKNADDYTEDGKSVNVRTSYGSRISEKQFIFDKDNNLLQIIDFGSSKEGNPDTSGGSSVNINANSKSKSIKAIVERGYNKGFATKVVDYIGESDSYAKGGSTKAKNGKVVSFDFTENTEVLLIIDGKGEEDFFKKGEGFNNIEVISETESKYLLQDTRGYVYEVPKKSVKIVKAYGEGGGIDLVHVYEKDGSLYGTGEIEKKVKGKTYVRFDAQTVKAFDHEQVKPIMKKGGAIKSEYFKGGLSFLNW